MECYNDLLHAMIKFSPRNKHKIRWRHHRVVSLYSLDLKIFKMALIYKWSKFEQRRSKNGLKCQHQLRIVTWSMFLIRLSRHWVLIIMRAVLWVSEKTSLTRPYWDHWNDTILRTLKIYIGFPLTRSLKQGKYLKIRCGHLFNQSSGVSWAVAC